MYTNRYADLIVHRLLLASLSNTAVVIGSSETADTSMAVDDAASIPLSQTPSVMQQQLQSEGVLVDTGINKQIVQSYTADSFDDLEGDDLLDALLGIDDNTATSNTATATTALALPWQNVSSAVKTAVTIATAEMKAELEDVVVQEEAVQDNEVALLLSTPELSALCEHLNDRHRSAKQLSTQCQELFLRLYFMVSALMR
jgi:hypothetical protein